MLLLLELLVQLLLLIEEFIKIISFEIKKKINWFEWDESDWIYFFIFIEEHFPEIIKIYKEIIYIFFFIIIFIFIIIIIPCLIILFIIFIWKKI
jgi:hypothetical protein